MAIKGKVAEGRKKKWKGALECFIPSRIIGFHTKSHNWIFKNIYISNLKHCVTLLNRMKFYSNFF